MSQRLRTFWLLLALPLAAAIGACTEDLQTGETCPVLCPGQGIEIKDTILDNVVVIDSSLTGFPYQGSEDPLLLAKRGDTLDVRVVVRFDSLQREYTRTGSTTPEPITDVDSAFVSVFLRASAVPTPTQWFIDVYNVWDSTLVDTIPGQLLPLFAPANLIGTYQGDTAFTDTLRVRLPIDTAYLRTLLGTPDRRLRVGLVVRAAAPVMFRMNPDGVGAGPRLTYKIVSTDNTVPMASRLPTSLTPKSPAALAADLTDFNVIVAAPNHLLANTFTVGGLPGSRSYLQLALPQWLTDSVGVLRAELLLRQMPVGGPSSGDTLQLDGHLVLAQQAVPDLFRAATLLSGPNAFIPSQRILPSDDKFVALNINALVRLWNTNNTARALPTAIVLRSNAEGASPAALRFYGSDALDPTFRPRIRVSYTPSVVLGRP